MSKRDRPHPRHEHHQPSTVHETERLSAAFGVERHEPTVASAMWWNNIRRAWFTGSPTAPVLVDPQPPAPGPIGEAMLIVHEAAPDIRRHFHEARIPPAVKVSA